MITPLEIRQKAGRKYWEIVRAWLDGEECFPMPIPCSLRLPEGDLAAARDLVQQLRNESKDVRGEGYTVQWEKRRSRKWGENLFPVRISIESRVDFLSLIGKTSEFERFCSAVEKLRDRYPIVVSDWLKKNLQQFSRSLSDLDGLLEVIDCFRQHPRPDCYLRELPVSVDTKFVEKHRVLLSQWLDLILPPSQIVAEERRFEARYGLRWPDSHVLIRFLDDDLQREMSFQFDEMSLPAWHVEKLKADGARVVVVENKINLLTLPRFERGLAMWGGGFGVANFRRFRWLQECELYYWGDIDAQGFEILSTLRRVFPNVRSVLMDSETQRKLRGFCIRGKAGKVASLPNLTEEEREAFDYCLAENLRIEQETIPHEVVMKALGPFRDRDSSR